MRVSNLMEFTENHRYFTSRDFTLGGLDRRVLAELYQPMAGAMSVALYSFLYHRQPEDSVGYSVPETQRKLFLGLGLELSPAARKQLIEASSRLEAVGLLQVFRHHNPLTDETLYEYGLIRPLAPQAFFNTVHLTLLLRDKLGRAPNSELREAFAAVPVSELDGFVNREEATVPFYEIFKVGTGGTVDPGMEAAWAESAPDKERTSAVKPPAKIRHADVLLRFPRGSANRGYVERLNRAPEMMEQLNYLAYKYHLEVPEICRLLDEDGMFGTDGTLLWDELQTRANLVYRQDRKREEERERFLSRGTQRSADEGESDSTPTSGAGRTEASGGIAGRAGAAEVGGTSAGTGANGEQAGAADSGGTDGSGWLLDIPARFQGADSVRQYNEMLRREPYTRMLARYFPGAVPDQFIRTFERIDLNYKLPEPVINVLIHYVLGMSHAQRLTQSFIDSVASNMLAKGVNTLENAVLYVRGQEQLNIELERRRNGELPAQRGGSSAGGTGGKFAAGGRPTQQQAGARGTRRKPDMPVVKDHGPAQEVSPEELEKMRELARKLKDKKSK